MGCGMSESPKERPSDDEEFERVLRNLVNTPHKPHKTEGEQKQTPPKSD